MVFSFRRFTARTKKWSAVRKNTVGQRKVAKPSTLYCWEPSRVLLSRAFLGGARVPAPIARGGRCGDQGVVGEKRACTQNYTVGSLADAKKKGPVDLSERKLPMRLGEPGGRGEAWAGCGEWGGVLGAGSRKKKGGRKERISQRLGKNWERGASITATRAGVAGSQNARTRYEFQKLSRGTLKSRSHQKGRDRAERKRPPKSQRKGRPKRRLVGFSTFTQGRRAEERQNRRVELKKEGDVENDCEKERPSHLGKMEVLWAVLPIIS